MKAADLDLPRLLEMPSKGGPLYFAGQRALLLDAVALGLLRRDLIDTFGMHAARGILTRFGYAHGWRTAETLRSEFDWDDAGEWRRAGGRLHTLQGLVSVEPVPASLQPEVEPFASAIWKSSYEAEQHILHVGQAEEAVCWTLSGFASGYLSFCNQREIYCIETRCMGKGDAYCQVEGHAREDWGPEIEPHLPYYAKHGLDSELERVTGALQEAERKLRAHRKELRRAGSEDTRSGMVIASEAMRRLVSVARRAAKVDSTVLLLGESGTGKERLARLIHDESPRAAGPFVALNCAAVTESLLESELFGHQRGAFTGANHDRPGLFEAANGGTLLLDEIGEVSPAMQVKLLRVLQEREIRRVGDNRSRPVNVRVIAATHRELPAEVKTGRFRQDLYYRLRVLELRIPPLRERPDDILPLARMMVWEAARRQGRPQLELSPAAAERLLHYTWPGNVRELQNAIERSVVLSSGRRIEAEDLPDELNASGGGGSAETSSGETVRLADVERAHILATLDKMGGNRAKAANALGIGIATLYRKLKEYGHG